MNEGLRMPNLAHELEQLQGGLVQFPKKERQAMSKKEEGYTKMPNSLIDDQIMAQLSDKAFKCLMFVMRQTIGFDRPSHAIAITQFQKYCGIKKRDTVMLCIKDLEDTNLIKVVRKRGVLNEYIFTPNQYHQTVLVPSNGTSTVKGDESSTVQQDSTSTVERGTIKETLKENIKENKKETSLVDNFKNDDVLKFIEYHAQDKKLYSLRELSSEYTIKSDFSAQAKIMNPDLTDEQILIEIKNFAQWSVNQNPRTAQDWLNNWIYRIEKFVKTKPKQAVAKPSKKNLSDSQIEMFSKKLCNLDDFASVHSNIGETQKQFESRIAIKLRDPENIKKWSAYLQEVKFTGNVEGFV